MTRELQDLNYTANIKTSFIEVKWVLGGRGNYWGKI